MAKFQRSQNSGTSFRSKKFHFQYPYRPCKVTPLFLSRYPQTCTQQTEKQQKSKHFAWPIKVLKSGILKIWKSAGWTPCPENVRKMAATVEEKATNSAAFVFDLLGNSSVRFEQFDGTTSLPFKSNGKYHLAGKVVTTPPEIFKKVVQKIPPIIQAKGNKPCIVMPPLPRYLFAGCCSDSGHCTNANDSDYQSLLMSGFVRLKMNW